ncbi:hypothetical protein CIPAW_15G045800 [Carya illinoinensis]|uniref:Uncharacterized protein n=1 Tax=Carya illinoinensis TaxID=32201 RepID=A0A8T1N9A3_CARIL|nr:hypothetical protein CIPAW_15G045800 [Carya illinoinensis]
MPTFTVSLASSTTQSRDFDMLRCHSVKRDYREIGRERSNCAKQDGDRSCCLGEGREGAQESTPKAGPKGVYLGGWAYVLCRQCVLLCHIAFHATWRVARFFPNFDPYSFVGDRALRLVLWAGSDFEN